MKIYGSRYGEFEPPAEDFHVWLCDPIFEVIKEFAFPYSEFKMRGLAKWATLEVEATALPAEFIICVGFDPHQTKGVSVYYDANGSGNSYSGLPGGELEPYNKGDWMIRAVVSKDAGSGPRPRTPARKGPPIVVMTSPVAFADDVSSDLKKITVIFDQPMMDKSWSWTKNNGTFPKMTGQPSYDQSRKTCNLPVELEPGKVYWVGINSPNYQGFKNINSVSAKRYVILFATKDKDGKATPIPEVMIKEARAINESRAEEMTRPK